MRLFWAILLLAGLAAIISCGSDDDEGTDTTAGEGEGDDEEVLTASHPGWRDPACLNCHEADAHNDGRSPADCAQCHGNNGALDKGVHGEQASCYCHMEVIADSHIPANDFPQPDSCVVCH